MKQKNIFFIAALTILIPAPARLGYGVVLLLSLVCINLCTALFSLILKNLSIETFEKSLHIFTTIVFTIVVKESIRYMSPLIAFNLHFSLYLVCFISPFFTMPAKIDEKGSGLYLASVLKNSILFCIYGTGFFILREYIAYGSISIPVKQGIKLIELPAVHLFNGSFLWSSSAFALILLALILVFVASVQSNNSTTEKDV